MRERYPYIQFIIDAAQIIAAALAVIIFIGGTVSSCAQGGFGGVFSFLVTILLAAAVYVVVMVRIEALRVFLDIESATRQLLAERHAGDRDGGTTAV